MNTLTIDMHNGTVRALFTGSMGFSGMSAPQHEHLSSEVRVGLIRQLVQCCLYTGTARYHPSKLVLAEGVPDVVRAGLPTCRFCGCLTSEWSAGKGCPEMGPMGCHAEGAG